ncbi:unnamed protein product [Urochloa humidicola]
MASNFSFPEMSAAQIAEALNAYNLAPSGNIREEDIANPQPDLLPNVFALFFINVVGDDLDEELGFEQLQSIDNPAQYKRSSDTRRIFRKARDFLDSIYFEGLTLRDFVLPNRDRVAYILSAIVNYLHFNHEKLAALSAIVQEFGGLGDQATELKARIPELQKVKEEHAYKEQMEEPAVQQLQAEVNAAKQTIQEYNTMQLSLRSRAKSLDDKKEGILAKISQADFQLMKHSQENSKLLSRIVQSPEKLQKKLEEKKAVRDELKTLEKMAAHNAQEKTNNLEMCTKACEKLSNHLSKISALHETYAAAKASEKEVKALKAKISDQSLEMKTLRIKADEWRSRVHETTDRLKEKEKERDQRIEENKRKMATQKSENESKLKSLEEREKQVQEKIAKAADLCTQSNAAEAAGRKKCEEICATFGEVCAAAKLYMDGIEHSIKEVDVATLAITGQRA